MKKEIVARLLKDGHINFDEALELMEKEVVREFITQPYPYVAPLNPAPFTLPYSPDRYTITC